MGNQVSRIQEGSPLGCLLKHWKDLDARKSSMRKDGHKEEALIIIPFFN
jgi:hypothetical protein